jgi:hypothetical protein
VDLSTINKLSDKRLGVYHRRRYLKNPGVHPDLMALARNGVEMVPGTQVKSITTRLHAHVPATIAEWFGRGQVVRSEKERTGDRLEGVGLHHKQHRAGLTRGV